MDDVMVASRTSRHAAILSFIDFIIIAMLSVMLAVELYSLYS